MRILYDNKIDIADLVAGSEAAGYPAENLQNIHLSERWRGAGDTEESVVIDAGGDLEDIFQAATNLMGDPEDLRAAGANWTASNTTDELSDLYYDGKRFTKIVNSGAVAGYNFQSLTDAWTTLTPSFSVIMRKGNSAGNVTRFYIRDTDDPADVFNLTIDWDNYPNAPGVPADGILHGYRWIDSETIEIRCICETLANLNDDLMIRCFASPNATANEYTYWTAVQGEDLPYPTPYTDSTRAIVHPDETFQMPSRFTIDMIVEPWFTYDTAIEHRFCGWYIDANHRMEIYYSVAAPDAITAVWKDGTALRWLSSQQFDDGSALTDINQRIRIIASIDLTTGDTTGSRLIVIPLESGALYEDPDGWSGNIDALSSTFPTLSIGHKNDLLQADSQYEYLRIYASNLVGTVTNNADATALLAEMNIVLENEYLPKITADCIALAGHNFSAAAEIRLQGNDYNSWNGIPLDEVLTWNTNIILKYFTENTYPFWRIYIDDVNNIDGYVELGRSSLGTYLQITPSSLIEFPIKNIRTDGAMHSKSGQLYSNIGIGYRGFAYTFPASKADMLAEIRTMWETVGKHTPYFFMNFDTDFTLIEPAYVSTINDFTESFKGRSQAGYILEMREVK